MSGSQTRTFTLTDQNYVKERENTSHYFSLLTLIMNNGDWFFYYFYSHMFVEIQRKPAWTSSFHKPPSTMLVLQLAFSCFNFFRCLQSSESILSRTKVLKIIFFTVIVSISQVLRKRPLWMRKVSSKAYKLMIFTNAKSRWWTDSKMADTFSRKWHRNR